MPGLDDDRKLLFSTVREAGALAASLFGQRTKSWLKDNKTPVSEADLAVNRLLADRLRPARPEYGWLSEETTDTPDRLSKKRVWVVDPIDGTRAFLDGSPHWCVSVALVADHRPILSAVFNPVHEEFFEAQAGHGAYLNGRALRTSRRRLLKGCQILVHGHVLERDIWPKPWPDMTIDMRNSMAYRLCLVAQGAYDAALTVSAKSDWDLAAADLIIAEAGGKLTSIADEPLRYNNKDYSHRPLVAGGPHLHVALLDYLKLL